jgi:hypothetical protein
MDITGYIIYGSLCLTSGITKGIILEKSISLLFELLDLSAQS